MNKLIFVVIATNIIKNYKMLPFVSLNARFGVFVVFVFFQVKDHKPNWIQLNEKIHSNNKTLTYM